MKVNVCMRMHIPNRYRFYSVSVYHKNVMMRANACFTCNLISTYGMLGYYNSSFQYSHVEQECVIKISVVHHILNASSGLKVRMGFYNHTCKDYNGHTRCAYTLKRVNDLSIFMISLSLHVCACTKRFL